jgi:hypothetical protein
MARKSPIKRVNSFMPHFISAKERKMQEEVKQVVHHLAHTFVEEEPEISEVEKRKQYNAHYYNLKKKTHRRFSIDLPIRKHKRFKILAKAFGKPMRDIIEDSIDAHMQKLEDLLAEAG